MGYYASDHLPKLFILLITLFLIHLFALTFVSFSVLFWGIQVLALHISCLLIMGQWYFAYRNEFHLPSLIHFWCFL